MELHLFGHPKLELDGQPVVLETRKALAIFIYLALSPQPVSREYLAALFWPEFSQSRALANLRRALSSLGNRIQGKVLEADRLAVFFKDPATLYTDVQDFRQKIKDVQSHSHERLETCEKCLFTLEDAIQAYRGEFMEGFNLPDCPDFDDWQYQQRQALQQELRMALDSHIQQCVARRRWKNGILSAQRLVAQDVLNEASRRKLMWLYAQDNQRNAALHEYEKCFQILQKELNQHPEPETTGLFQNIRDGNPIQCEEMQELLSFVPAVKPIQPLPSLVQQANPTSVTVLRTKLFIPSVRAGAVNRPRLIARINQGVQGALTLVSAPAGFGKTTLLASWAAQSASPVGWLSLEADDNDPVRFMTYLVMGLKSVWPQIGNLSLEMLASPQSLPVSVVLTHLLNEISGLKTGIVLVLDDYHAITAEPVQKVISFILDHLCPHLHLVLATRSDPLLPLARLRARNQLVELRAEDLHFSIEETADFLNSMMGLNLSPQEVTMIGERTEGWVTGLQMAALSMSGRPDKTRFIQAFSGSHQYILDYLLNEVLNQQPAPIQTFLLETSILECLTGSLCNALTGNNDGQEMLEMLERLNLFLVPLDDEHHWYRYHQLFAGLLRSRFQFTKQDLFTTLHERASDWFEQNGDLRRSIFHAIEAKDYVRSANMIEKVIGEELNFNGREIIAWIDQIPEGLVYERSFLCLAKAIYFSNRFQQAATSQWLQSAEEHAFADYIPNETNIILGIVDTTRAVMATIRGDLPDAMENAFRASQRLTDKFLRFDALGILGETYYLSGNIQGAIDQWDEVKTISEAAKNTYGIIEALESKARAMLQLGKLKEEEQIFCMIFQLAAEKGIQEFHIALARLWYSDLLREWNELEQAEQQVSEGVTFFSEEVRPDNLCLGYIFQAFISLAHGNLLQANEACQRAEKICRQINIYPDIVAMTYLCKIRLGIASGRLQDADQVLQECLNGELFKHDLLKEWFLITKARLWIAQGRSDEVGDLLFELAKDAQSAGRIRDWIEILILQSTAFVKQGQKRESLSVLIHCLLAAEMEGYIRLFVSEGETMRQLLQEISSRLKRQRLKVENRDRLLAYINKLEAAFSPAPLPNGNTVSSMQPVLPEPISSRELEVLQLLCAGLSNHEIAEKLFITNSTVKSHIHHLFGKIGVESRPQAIVRARELNLV